MTLKTFIQNPVTFLNLTYLATWVFHIFLATLFLKLLKVLVSFNEFLFHFILSYCVNYVSS